MIRAIYLLSFVLTASITTDAGAQNLGVTQRHEARKGTAHLSRPIESGTTRSAPCVNGEAGAFSCRNIDLLSFLPIDEIGGRRNGEGRLLTSLNDIWGWTDPETGREYALVGRTDGTAFVDITDPGNPIYVGSLPSNNGEVSTWRDIKVLDHYALVVADGNIRHGLQIFDLYDLRGVVDAPVEFTATADTSMFMAAHNIVVNDSTDFAYAVGSDGACPGLLMIDLSDPTEPKEAGCYADTRVGLYRNGYTHDAQCVIYRGPDADYSGREICFGANETAVQITDVTDKDTPVTLAIAAYPNVSYSHQGWLTPDQRYFFQDDELDEVRAAMDPALEEYSGTRTLIWNVEDLDDPQLAGIYHGTAPSIDHNMYIVGNLAFQSNYASGLRVLDISDPLEPEEVGFFDTYPPTDSAVADSAWQFEGAWSNYPFFESGVVVVSSIGEGLFVLKPNESIRIVPPEPEIPKAFRLLPVYPNPFNAETTIRVEIEVPQRMRIAIFDAQGKEVAELFSGFIATAGTKVLTFDAAELASGVYIVRVVGSSGTHSTTVTLVR